MVTAKAGDVLVVVDCCHRGPVAVLAYRRGDWRCGRCGSPGRDIEVVDGYLHVGPTITLETKGAHPGALRLGPVFSDPHTPDRPRASSLYPSDFEPSSPGQERA